ncbi:MAG: hypothetical protein PHS41_00735 [Victivallaceae bacterium]|nr:hypothetical protein [Victivallaceae bacterium]
MKQNSNTVSRMDYRMRFFDHGASVEVTLVLTPREKRAALLVASVMVDGFELLESARVQFDDRGNDNRALCFQLHHHRAFAGEEYQVHLELFGGASVETLEGLLTVTAPEEARA